MGTSESDIQQLIQIDAMNYRCNLMRNNSGAMKGTDGNYVRFGLGNVSPKQGTKSSDLIGFTQVVITPEMVGKTIAVFTAVEVKEPAWKPGNDKREHSQRAFLDWVKAKGGFAGFANSVESFRKILGV